MLTRLIEISTLVMSSGFVVGLPDVPAAEGPLVASKTASIYD